MNLTDHHAYAEMSPAFIEASDRLPTSRQKRPADDADEVMEESCPAAEKTEIDIHTDSDSTQDVKRPKTGDTAGKHNTLSSAYIHCVSKK